MGDKAKILKRGAKEALILTLVCFGFLAFIRVGVTGVDWLVTGLLDTRTIVAGILLWAACAFAFFCFYGGFNGGR